jgi:hypothetical protein
VKDLVLRLVAPVSLVASCGPKAISLPSTEQAASAVLLIEGSSQQAWAHDLVPPAHGLPATFPSSDRATLLLYETTLAELRMPEGLIPAAQADDPVRKLPDPSAAYVLAPDRDQWAKINPSDSAFFESFRFRGDSARLCLEAEGCFPDGDVPYCIPHCLEPPPPAPPSFTDLPTPPNMVCRSAWTRAQFVPRADTAYSFDDCVPFPGGLPLCSHGDQALPGSSGCSLVGAPCPSGDGYPNPTLTGRTIYVAQSAQAGNGSRSSPLSSIAAAMAVAQPGDSVVLHAGLYLEDVALSNRVALRGACAKSTTIAGSISIAGSSTVSDVSLVLENAPSLHASAGASLSMQAAILSGDLMNVTLDQGARVAIASSIVLGATASVALGANARLEIRGSTLFNRELNVSGDSSSRVILSDSVCHPHYHGWGPTLEAVGVTFLEQVAVFAGNVQIAQSSFEGVRAFGVLTAQHGQLQLNSTRFDVYGEALLTRAEKASISDVLMRTRAGSAAVGLADTDLTGSRIVLDVDFGSGIVAQESANPGAPPNLDLSSISIFGASLNGFEVSDRVGLVANEVLVAHVLGKTMDIIGGRHDGTIDTDVSDIRAISTGGGIRLSDGRRARIQRFALTGSAFAGLVLMQGGSPPDLEASDVDLEVDKPTPGFCNRRLDCGSVIDIEQGTLEMSRFKLANNTIGASLIVVTGVHLKDGLLRNLQIGISADGSVDLGGVIEGLSFDHVDHGCSPCGR